MILKLISNTLCGSHKEQKNTYRTLMVVKKENLNRKRTQATTGRDAQLNFTKLLEVTKAFRSHCSEAMLEPDASFYLTINHQRKPNDKLWYFDIPLGKNGIGKSSKTTLLTQTRRRFLITPSKRPVLDDFSKQMFSQTSSHS